MGTGVFCLSFFNTHSQNTHPCPTLCKEGGKVLRGGASGPDQRDSVLRAQDPRTAGYDTEGEPGAVAATQLHVSGPFPSLSEQTYPANFKGPTLTGRALPTHPEKVALGLLSCFAFALSVVVCPRLTFLVPLFRGDLSQGII